MRFDPLPSALVIDKPRDQESYEFSLLQELDRRGALIGTRKNDGHQMRAEMCSNRRIRLYTRKMHQVDDRLDYIRDEIVDAGLPEGTLLIGEVVIRSGNMETGPDDEGAIGSFMNSGRAKAKAFLARGPLPMFIPFNILHPHHSSLVGVPYHRALKELRQAFPKPGYVLPVRPLQGDLGGMEALRVQHDWEGLVVYDHEYTLGYRLKGDPATPHGCYKLKPHASDDFIVFARHRNFTNGRLTDVALLQWDRERNKLAYCGKLGTFNAEMKKCLTANDWDVKVMEVKYVRRWPKKGTLREPAFVRLRDPKDKDPDSCVSPRSYPEAEFYS